MKFKTLPDDIKFKFKDLDKPSKIAIDVGIAVYMGDEKQHKGEPVGGTAVLTFERERSGNYVFSEVEVFCQEHDIKPYSDEELENQLRDRMMEIFSSCSLPGQQKIDVALKNFLSEYGKSHELNFFL